MAGSYRAILLATACAVALAGPAGAQSVVSFGDSLSDSGNISTLTRGAQPASPPYFQGRFSNGPVFTEVLAGGAGSMQNAGARALLGAPIDPNASQNYAFGGALSGLTPLGTVPVGARTQVELFAARDGRFAAGDVVTLLAGANNLRGALTGSPTAIPAIAAASVNDIALASGRLAQLGAPTVAVLTLPDLSLTPEVRAAGPVAASLASQTTRGFNTGVAQAVSRVLRPALRRTSISSMSSPSSPRSARTLRGSASPTSRKPALPLRPAPAGRATCRTGSCSSTPSIRPRAAIGFWPGSSPTI